MSKKKGTYAKKSRKKGVLSGITETLETKGDLKNTAIETLKDLIAGVLAGGIAGAAIGRSSLVVGAVVTGIGHYTKSRLASIFGVGMMASNGFQKTGEEVSGTGKTGILNGVKERLTTYKESFLQKLFLDKILKKTEKTESGDGTSGVGEVRYFVYPGEKGKELDMSELERIEKAIAESGEQFSQEQQNDDGLHGASDEDITLDPGEKNY